MAAGKPAVLKIDVQADDTHAKSALSGFSSFTTGITAGIAAGVTGAIAGVVSNFGSMVLDFGTDVINAGFKADDAMDHMVRVFQDGAQQIILAWAGVAPQTFGVTAAEFEEGATKLGRVLTNMGADQTTAANLVVETAQMAADLAETYGGTWGDAFDTLENVALGKFKAISKFTGTFTDEMVAQTDAALSFAGAGTTGADLAKARLETAFGLLGGVSGAFKDDLNDVDGAVANMKVQFDQFKEQLGTQLLPVLGEMLPILQTLFQMFVDNKDTILDLARLSVLGIAGLQTAMAALKASIDSLSWAWSVLSGIVNAVWPFVVRATQIALSAFASFGAAAAAVAGGVMGAWNALVSAVGGAANAILGIVSRVAGAIRTLISLAQSLPGVGAGGGILGSIVDRFNPFGSFAPTALGASIGTPVVVQRGAAAGGVNATVFGAVTGDQVVSALARYTKNTASLTASGVRIS